MDCINHCNVPPPCPAGNNGEPQSGGGATKMGANSSKSSLGTTPPGGQKSSVASSTPGFMADPGTPDVSPNIPFGGTSMKINMGTNQRALTITQTDIAVKTVGDLDLAFKRVYYNPWGKHQEYQDSNDRPFKNNIGSGWRHNFNVHVRLSTENGMAYYMDANNNYKKFERSQEDVNGYDIYIPMPQGNYHVLTEELSVVMRRNVNDGTVIIEFPQGNTCHFSAPINDYERYCRLESFTDVSGNTFTLTYADLWLYGIDDVLDNFGRLSRVDAPCGDDRYLQFSYAGDLISKVELVKPSGTGTEVIKQVEYTYGPYQDGQQTPANFLRAVEVDDNVDDTVAFEYD